MLKEVIRQHLDGIGTAISPEQERLRFINWYLQHGCDLDCYYCQVPKQRVSVMSQEERIIALNKLRKLAAREAIVSIIGGEPTLKSDSLLEAVRNASKAGFFVNLVSNGWGLNPDLIKCLGQAGLKYLAVSVDCEQKAEKSNLPRALEYLKVARSEGIIPVVNTVITSEIEPSVFKTFVQTVIDNGSFISPLACTPQIPDGVFSSAPLGFTPHSEHLRNIVPWLAWKKLTTGRVTGSFGYLWELYRSGQNSDGSVKLWHCSSNFRNQQNPKGRGYLTLDSDGYIGPCQEFPRLVNLLEIPDAELSLQGLNEQFAQATGKCPGCLYNCYIMEEGIAGPKVILEAPTALEIGKVLSGNRLS